MEGGHFMVSEVGGYLGTDLLGDGFTEYGDFVASPGSLNFEGCWVEA